MALSSVLHRFDRRCLVLIVLVVSMLGFGPMLHAQHIEGVTRQHFADYVKLLDLDEDQQAVAWSFFEDYRRAYKEELLPVIRAYGAKMPGIQNPAYEKAREEYKEEREAIQEAMRRRVEALFAGLESLLRPDQHERMQRVRYARERQLWRTWRGELPGGNVDVAQLALGLDLSGEEEEAVFDVLDWYEPQLIAALQDSRQMWRKLFPLSRDADEAMRQRIKARERRDEIAEAAFAAEYRELEEEMSRVATKPKEHLVELNKRGLAALRAVLSEENSRELLRLYREEAYPEVWPDPANATVLYDAAEAIDSLSEAQRQQLAVARAQFERRHEHLSKELAEAFWDRRKGNLAWSGIFEPGLEREAFNARQINVLRTILTPEQMEELPEWDFEKNPPARPWDWGNRVRQWGGTSPIQRDDR